MVKQFYTSVRAAFKSVPLPFIHIYHPASFPIYRYYPAPPYFIAYICPPFPLRPPRCLQHIPRYTDGPAALPVFALAIASLTSDTDINLSSTDASSLFITSML